MSEMKIKRFVFQNSNGKYYDVRLDMEDGTGRAWLMGDSVVSTPRHELTETSLEFDNSDLDGKDVSYISHRAKFGASSDTSLDDTLNDS